MKKNNFFAGKITNAMIIRCPGDLGSRVSSPLLSPISNFKRHLFDPFHDAMDLEGAENNGSLVPVVLKDIEQVSKLSQFVYFGAKASNS